MKLVDTGLDCVNNVSRTVSEILLSEFLGWFLDYFGGSFFKTVTGCVVFSKNKLRILINSI